MPIYEYRCRRCGDLFDARHAAGDTVTVTCPQGHEDAERLLSLIAPVQRSGSESPGGEAGGGCCAAGCSCGASAN